MIEIDPVASLKVEAKSLEQSVRQHPALSAFFDMDFSKKRTAQLRIAYMQLLKITADYVAYTVPMLRAAGDALREGDKEDAAWSRLFLGYSEDETDDKEKYGHDVWARNDLAALGAPASLLVEPQSPYVTAYGKMFVEDAKHHPYAILGTKGVLEHLSISICDELVRGVIASGIENAENAVSFFSHHGILDIDHVAEGDRNLERITVPERRSQILTGAFYTSGCYRAFLQFGVTDPCDRSGIPLFSSGEDHRAYAVGKASEPSHPAA
jgi:hypothetical protein